MPVPANNTKWPPSSMRDAYAKYELHDAWYSGDGSRLANIYYKSIYNPMDPSSSFWARRGQKQRSLAVHMPIAGDISSTSASMLFGEHPKISFPGSGEPDAAAELIKAQARLDDMIETGGVYNTLSSAAEVCSALGGVFFKVNWDTSVFPFPILCIAQADTAVPEFTFGIMTAVSFWKELSDDDDAPLKSERIPGMPNAPRSSIRAGEHDTIFRHIEYHERGIITNALYRGTKDNLGERLTLLNRPETADMRETIQTGVDGLLCEYIPNMLPNRQCRGSAMGQSDYAGTESLMDSLDEVYTSLMRDIRLGQGRMMIPESFLERDSAGHFSFDLDQEAFIATNQIPTEAGIKIDYNQFEIRTEQHIRAATELLIGTVTTAGYSPQSFGLGITGTAESGTALTIRERKSFITSAKKSAYWRPAIENIMLKMLTIDSIHFNSGVKPAPVTCEMQASVSQDMSTIATSVEMLNRAAAVSLATKVRMVHPDWSPKQVADEVQAIQDEVGMAVPDLGTLNLPNAQTDTPGNQMPDALTNQPNGMMQPGGA